MRGPSGQTRSAKFRRSGSPTPRDNRDFRLLLWGVTGPNTGQLAYFGDTFTGSGGTETPHCTFGMRGPSGQTSLPSFVALGHLLREIIATSGSYYGGNGAIRAS
ncbi:hypothetical protein DPMN_076503 [Dreissena polymorpha]|uniref:Uncharacterized protein n=1 Tax=Dreissena polymorpha TaxID=45954 RepID=A0A9D3YMH1_DREPO|nr:hypothetical protein DPMN_076503 [Dreissena polymorpha]